MLGLSASRRQGFGDALTVTLRWQRWSWGMQGKVAASDCTRVLAGRKLGAQSSPLKSSSEHQMASKPPQTVSLIPFSYRTDISKKPDPRQTVTDWPSLTCGSWGRNLEGIGLWRLGTGTFGRTWMILKILTSPNPSISLSFPGKKPLKPYLMIPAPLCLKTCNKHRWGSCLAWGSLSFLHPLLSPLTVLGLLFRVRS